MNHKMAALSLAVVTALALSGCSGSATADAPAQNQTQTQTQPQPQGRGAGRSGQRAADPEMQQLMQDQQQNQKQISELIKQIHTDAGLPGEQTPPAGGGQRGNGGQGQQGAPNQQDLQAARDAIKQEEQAGTDLIARLTTFDGLVKQAANNQKALKDAQSLFSPIEESLQPAGGRGYRGQNGNGGGSRNMTQGLHSRIDTLTSASKALDAAIAQLRTDLGQ